MKPLLQLQFYSFFSLGKAKASDNENYNATCMDAIRKHIKVEFSASLQYLMMAAHFAQDTINLNGFAQLFFKR